jgi:transposase
LPILLPSFAGSNVKPKTDKDDAHKLARMASMNELEALGRNDSRIQRIRTISGVGPRTAEVKVACIDNPHRFTKGRQVSAYFDLVSRQYQSGETDRNGRITKRGNTLARKIAVLAWAMLRDEKNWEPNKMIQVTEFFGKMKPEAKVALPKPRRAGKLVSAV